MKQFVRIDDYTPIEEYPGVLGYTSDYDEGPSIFDSALEPLKEIDWNEYAGLAQFGEAREIVLQINSVEHRIALGETLDLANILDQTALVDVYRDFPENQGMASGTFYPIFRRDSVSNDQLRKGIRTLVDVLLDDFRELKHREIDWRYGDRAG